MSLMQQYSDIYGIPLHEIQAWVNDYARGDVPEPVKEWMDPDREERIESIKAYIQCQVDESLTGQIKGQIISDRIAMSTSKEVAVCPF